MISESSAPDCSMAETSVKPPSRLAMSPDGSGSPSSTVTIPTWSVFSRGAMTVTESCEGFNPNDAGVSIPSGDTRVRSSGDTGNP